MAIIIALGIGSLIMAVGSHWALTSEIRESHRLEEERVSRIRRERYGLDR